MSLKQLFYKARYGGLPALLNKNALFKAVETGNMHLTNHLLTKANVDNQDKSGNTVLHYAVKNNRHDIAKILLEWGAKPDIANNNGKTASDFGVANIIFAKISLAQNYANCMQPLLENHDVKITNTDSLVDVVRWYIDSSRTLNTLTNQQQVQSSTLCDDVPNNDVVLSGDGMITDCF